MPRNRRTRIRSPGDNYGPPSSIRRRNCEELTKEAAGRHWTSTPTPDASRSPGPRQYWLRDILSFATILTNAATEAHSANVLRARATQTVLPFRVMAPSTLGTFLRSLGHIRQMDRVIAETTRRGGGVGGRARRGACCHRHGLHDLCSTRPTEAGCRGRSPTCGHYDPCPPPAARRTADQHPGRRRQWECQVSLAPPKS